ncbi:uncharacterized protein LOC135121616 [Zophobas morio]|uniref:uncharacterized protein LOC135121616 n=1 Tax=Zophobas morio TaxID=2755281 RepID=UPI003083265F
MLSHPVNFSMSFSTSLQSQQRYKFVYSEFFNKENTSTLINTIASVLQEITYSLPKEENKVASPFNFLKEPSISILDYFTRIASYVHCTRHCFVLALIYIDRFMTHGSLTLSPCNAHRLLLTSLLVAIKYFDDNSCSNAYMAKVGGIPRKELLNLELCFLFTIKFRLNVEKDLFEDYCLIILKKYDRDKLYTSRSELIRPYYAMACPPKVKRHFLTRSHSDTDLSAEGRAKNP